MLNDVQVYPVCEHQHLVTCHCLSDNLKFLLSLNNVASLVTVINLFDPCSFSAAAVYDSPQLVRHRLYIHCLNL